MTVGRICTPAELRRQINGKLLVDFPNSSDPFWSSSFEYYPPPRQRVRRRDVLCPEISVESSVRLGSWGEFEDGPEVKQPFVVAPVEIKSAATRHYDFEIRTEAGPVRGVLYQSLDDQVWSRFRYARVRVDVLNPNRENGNTHILRLGPEVAARVEREFAGISQASEALAVPCLLGGRERYNDILQRTLIRATVPATAGNGQGAGDAEGKEHVSHRLSRYFALERVV